MRNGLYPKLAARSMRQNRRFFVPYLLALAGLTAAFYVMSALCADPGVMNMRGFAYVMVMMQIGMFVAGILSAVLLLYINSFLMKQRKKELGLYNILGMGKSHIALVLAVETVYIGVLGIGGGIAVGLLLHKLVTLVIHQMLGMPVPLGFYISWDGMAQTALLFALLLGAALLVNLNRVRVANPIELLRSGNVGEREPRTRWLLTLLGVGTLGAGYYIAVKTKTGVEAIMWYFVAVFLVIIGTYCLFTAVSVFILKALRANKSFYYKTSHFIGVSGMLYRMKQNAVGLANICILCTMVMVMLSGTLSLYLGTEDIIRQQYPGDINVKVYYVPDPEDPEDPFDPEAMLSLQKGFVESQGVTVTKAWTNRELGFGAGLRSDGTYTTDRFSDGTVGSVVSMTVLSEADYTALTGEALGLKPGEAAVYGAAGDTLTIRWTVAHEGRELGQSTFSVVKKLREDPTSSPMIAQMVTVVVPDEETVSELWELQAEAYGVSRSNMLWYAHLDVDCDEAMLETLEARYEEAVEDDSFYDGTGSWYSSRWDLRSEGAAETYGLAGGFLFLGIFLGFIFILATVLIIYYKQISEGYEDKERFEIMQKVGLSRGEVKRSIHSQILMVFFLPIVVASIHIAFDFNMVEKLLTLFYIHNTALTALCTLGTVLVFFLAYGVVYLLTARTYYKIVERS